MDVRTFRAATMQDALALVRRELGPLAAVLHTRELYGHTLVRWIPGLRQIEVTASAEVNVPSRFAPPADAPKPAAPVAPTIQATTMPAPTATMPTENRQAFREELRGQLNELQAMVEDLCRRNRSTGRPDLPETLFRLYTQLIDAEVSEAVARELVERVRNDVDPADLDDMALLNAHLVRMIEREVAIAGPLALQAGKCRRVALVGPTGVGKTTTIAKLAANYRLRDKRRVGLITVDTYRIAAVEQLRTYADIIDLPMQVVATPRQMREAVAQMAHLDLVLIDTAGRSPKDEIKLQELKAFLAEAEADEVHLVLSAVASASVLQNTAERFGHVGTTALVLTKLDEATSLGHLLPLVRNGRLPISYLTDGQNVPDDIAPADRARLTKLMLTVEAPTPPMRPLDTGGLELCMPPMTQMRLQR
ncbi:MAG: flagellar biosynthesis protein FlhF [Planctomycetes bacterium]|nr:flagellar biosynthesis protein FlhF [Planctomycetota bacterium]